ncbi:hypothetical protein [Flavobacterium sp. 7A]|uniref:hypothetical protein n=1 Tax=Flavobacterium sp. 7A TaxID=2940571 RepID=UPI00222748ED|nr:hypothetical protein [Flavobacterium sp. 7A]MCW2118557.1 hypothetical protein [Flavobacterium sp. 7A]
MKNVLFTNWHAMRWIRLAISAFMILQAIQHHEIFFGFIGAFFLFQAGFNSGCSLNGCTVPTYKNNKNE